MTDYSGHVPDTVRAACSCGIKWELRFTEEELLRLQYMVGRHTAANPGHVAGVDDGSA